MRIVSLVPSATEMLFALGVGDEVTAVTHECDHPAAALELPRVTRDVIGPGLPPDEIDRAVRALTEQGRAIYELDEDALQRLQPDLIVTQALCAVCAVSYDDVRAVAERLDSRPQVLALDPHTLGEVLGDVRTLAQATDAKDAGVELIQDAAQRIDRVRLAVRAARAGRRRRARVARPGVHRRPLDAAADRVRRRLRPARPARRALPAAHAGTTSAPPSPRS